MTPPLTLARYRASTGSHPRTPRGAALTPPPTTTYELSRHRSPRAVCGMVYPRQMFHVEQLPDFFVGKTPFLSLLFVL